MSNIFRLRRAEGGVADINDPSYLEQNPMPTEGAEEEIDPMIAVHLSEEECLELDKLQGGRIIDEATGFRSYRPLAKVIKIPEIRELFEDIAEEMMLSGHEDPQVKELEDILPHKLPKFVPSPSDFDPEVLETEAHGTDGDNELELLPLSVADYFDSLRGYTDYNKDGFRQYKFFHEFIRVAATVAGAVIGGAVGGPYGAAAGAGIGNSLGNAVTGAGKDKSINRGMRVGATAAALATGYNAFSGAGATTGSGLGSTGSGLGSTPTAGQLSGTSPYVAEGLKETVPSTVGGGGLGSLFSSSNIPIISLLSGAGLMYAGGKSSAKKQEEIDEEERQKLDALRKYYGIKQDRMVRVSPNVERHINTEIPSYWDRSSGRYNPQYTDDASYTEYYAKGGAVDGKSKKAEEFVQGFKYLDGKTKGQDDKVDITLRPGAYVVDASTTSMLGDGNSRAGAEALRLLNNALEKKAKTIKNLEIPKGEVPASLSDGEPVLSPIAISALGDGSNKKGADRMKSAIEEVRKEKTKNGKGLPPKIGPIHTYFDPKISAYNDIKKVGRHA